jgi:hypothetical protein
VAGSRYCFFHDPDAAAKRKAAQKAGGQGRQIKVLSPSAPDAKLKDARDAVNLLAETINQVRRGEIDPKVANAVGYLTGLLLKALYQTDLEQRVTALEVGQKRRSLTKRINEEEDEDDWRVPLLTKNGNGKD